MLTAVEFVEELVVTWDALVCAEFVLEKEQ